MPFPPPSHTPAGPRRRTLLASAAGAALLLGCSAESDKSATSAGSPSAAERARARAAHDSAGLVRQYDTAIAAFPGLAEPLSQLRAEVVRHAEAFGGGKPTPPPPTPTPTSTPTSASASPSASASASVTPTSERDALVGLAAAERALVDRRTKALLEVPGELARLLASVAAAGDAHVYLLTEGAK
ncbi:MAG: hypothetical protein JF621_15405 [Streptomyces turgidiscabies]|nr:hypothetical protein [Streptomyces turgidiscabies]